MRTSNRSVATVPPPGLRRLGRRVAAVFHDINAAQRLMFEINSDFDRYVIDTPDRRYLHWVPATRGWQLRGDLLPPTDGHDT